MKTSYKKYFLAAALLVTSAGTAMAQDINSAYFTDDFMYRHDMNPAFGNEQGYAAIPVLGNVNFKLQGNLGVGDIFFKNPDYGVKAGAKKTTTFMHPGISANEGLKGFDKGTNTILFDNDITIASVGFKAFDGYNTVELRERSHFGLSMPYEFFEFAKNMTNKNYSFDDMGARGWSYLELGFGHSRKIFDNLRVGAKVKVLLGAAYADVSMDGMHANLQGNKWLIDGKAKAELNMKGASFKEKEDEYKSKPGKYNHVDGIDIDGSGITGFGLGMDLGAVYELRDMPVEWLDGLRVSLALTDLGFISWSNGITAESSGEAFEFDGFNNLDMTSGDGKHTFDDEMDKYKDKMSDFANLQSKGSGNSATHGLASTLRFGLEYPLPVYDKVTIGILYNHRFDNQYSWSEGRFSANYKPLSWLDGGINLATSSFCTTMGWVLNVHPSGFNFFIGMDHLLGKTGASMIPLDSNVSFNMGMNITWGGSKKESDKKLRALTF